ncbi:MAG: hypothetical protein KBG48_22415 [Kofleriaceae bacterium]|jgi:hypothetical protein|nr:hypothetical protein [Kofleriaceae bacterium]MBP9170177.1 hypothetical protein [Kofleriaceae bacterium]MBP9859828.1 hypothetical protein [Kofleriaceae bacterium]
MVRWILVTLMVVSLGLAGWLWRDNRRLRDELAARPKPAADGDDPWREVTPPSPGTGGGAPMAGLLGRKPMTGSGPRPTLDDPKAESRLERRLRRQEQMATMLGRAPGESEADYKARITPMVELALGGRRNELADMRRAAEQAAGVTEAQRAELDAAFGQVYDEVLAYTNSAIADGSLTPYERNVKGLLQYAGGLGSILEGAEGRIGSILRPEQVDSIYQSGFEWGEYLGVNAPWEQLTPPPARPR